MRFQFFAVVFFLAGGCLSGQYLFEGEAPPEYFGEVVYLDILDGWNDFRLVSDEQVLQRVVIDTAGRFRISGEGLPARRGFYRLRFRYRSDPAVSMNFLQRHVVHFVAGPDDSLSFAGLAVSNPDPTNALIARAAERLDALNDEEMHAETPRLQALIDNKRKETLGNMLSGEDVAADVFMLGNWPLKDPPLHLLPKLKTRLEHADLRPVYLSSLRADLAALNATNSRQNMRWWKWGLGASLLLNTILLILLWRARGIRGEVLKEPGPVAVDLTPREEEVLSWIAEGQSNKEIAARLFVSQDTVKSHINSIYKKAGLGNRREAKAWYRARGSRV